MTQQMKRQKTKEKLKDGLQSGFLVKIQAILNEKGFKISRSKISKVCNPDLTDWDLDVIEAATELMEKETSRESELTQRVSEI